MYLQLHMGTPAVSIVVASHRPDLVTDLVSSLIPEVTGDLPFEIIIVADYPISELQQRHPKVRWRFLDQKSISAKRNIGIHESQSEIVAFIDDDCTPKPDWLTNGVSHLGRVPGAAGVEGRTVIERGQEGTRREYLRLERRGFRTNNVFYRRRVLLEVGCFDERFTVQREDLDLAFSILDKGYDIGYDESILVEHRFRHWEKWDVVKNCVNRRFDPLLYKKHPRRYREHVGSPFPPGLAIVLAAHASLLLSPLLAGGWRVAPFAADIVLVCGYALRRTHRALVSPGRLIREIISAFAAPLVLLGALIYGSVKYRRMLLF